jgi:hypothetical protein
MDGVVVSVAAPPAQASSTAPALSTLQLLGLALDGSIFPSPRFHCSPLSPPNSSGDGLELGFSPDGLVLEGGGGRGFYSTRIGFGGLVV